MRVAGFRFAGVAAGIKASGGPDVALIAAEAAVPAAAVFTRNRVHAAPVALSRERVRSGRARAIVVNSGNANACTGRRGLADARAMTRAVAGRLGGTDAEVLVASTGVIGVPLPLDRVTAGIAAAAAELAEDGFDRFAAAILTTDRGPKVHRATVRLGGRTITVAGCAKGAGMIAPNMATTLAFVVCDAPARAPWLRRVLREEVEETFNRVLVDGDTSTNDSLFLLASGAAGGRPVDADDASGRKLRAAVREVLEALATLLVRDGEGATRLVRIAVTGARTGADATAVARCVATSPLVKTAFHGADPNWGRILAAAGRAGVPLDPDRLELRIGDVVVARRGMGVPGADRAAHAVMKQPEYDVTLALGVGRGRATCTTCDLGHEYVRINADYRT